MDINFDRFLKDRNKILDKNIELLSSSHDKLYQRLVNYKKGGIESFSQKIVLKKTKKRQPRYKKKTQVKARSPSKHHKSSDQVFELFNTILQERVKEFSEKNVDLSNINSVMNSLYHKNCEKDMNYSPNNLYPDYNNNRSYLYRSDYSNNSNSNSNSRSSSQSPRFSPRSPTQRPRSPQRSISSRSLVGGYKKRTCKKKGGSQVSSPASSVSSYSPRSPEEIQVMWDEYKLKFKDKLERYKSSCEDEVRNPDDINTYEQQIVNDLISKIESADFESPHFIQTVIHNQPDNVLVKYTIFEIINFFRFIIVLSEYDGAYYKNMIRLNCELIFCLNSKYRLYNNTDITMNDYETLRQIIGSTFYKYEDEEKVWNSGWVYRDLDWDNLHLNLPDAAFSFREDLNDYLDLLNEDYLPGSCVYEEGQGNLYNVRDMVYESNVNELSSIHPGFVEFTYDNRVSRFNPDKPDVDNDYRHSHYLNEYFKLFYKVNTPRLSTLLIMLKDSPVGRVEYKDEAGSDYGGLRDEFFTLLMDNFKNTFLLNDQKNEIFKIYKSTKSIRAIRSKLKVLNDSEDSCKLDNGKDQYHLAPFNKKLGFNSYMKYSFFKGDDLKSELSTNYVLAGGLLGKILSCDNGIICEKLDTINHERIIFPNIKFNRYMVERLLGNLFEDPFDIFVCMLMDDPDFFGYTFGTPPVYEKGIYGSGLFMGDLSYIIESCNDLKENLPDRYTKRFKNGINENNILSFLYIYYINSYEQYLEEELYCFSYGFNYVINVNDKKISLILPGRDEEEIELNGSDLSYIFEGGDLSYDLFEKVVFENDEVSSEYPDGKYKQLFLEIVKELFIEKEVDGEIILLPSKNIRKLLTFWTGSPKFTHSVQFPIKIKIIDFLDLNTLPESHTCFNYMDIPKYENKDTFKSKLIQAFSESNTFEFAGGNRNRR